VSNAKNEDSSNPAAQCRLSKNLDPLDPLNPLDLLGPVEPLDPVDLLDPVDPFFFYGRAAFLLKMRVKFFHYPNDRYIDCLSLTSVTNEGKMLKLQCKYKRKDNIQRKYKSPNDKELSQKKVIEKEQSQFSIIFVLAFQYRSHSALSDSVVHCPRWVHITCNRGQGGLRCDKGVYPSNHAERIVEILQPPFFLASLLFWLFVASMVFGITLSLGHVCVHFGTSVSYVV
jgi:hypothetical protein